MTAEIFVTAGQHTNHAIADCSQHLASAGKHNVVLDSKHAVFDFGAFASTQNLSPTLVGALLDIESVGAGRDHGLARNASGRVIGWGRNTEGQLGADPAQEPLRSIPDTIAGITDVIRVSGGAQHTLALRSDGSVFAWGSNESGQLGTADPVGIRYIPLAVPLTNVRDIAAGDYHSLAIRGDGTLWAWGKGNTGQLGDGATTPQRSPVPRQVNFPRQVHVIAAAASNYFSLALDSDGVVWAWGSGPGILGVGGPSRSLAPLEVPGLVEIKAIASGDTHAVALRANGKVLCWGRNSRGLGDGSSTFSAAPVEVAGLSDAVAVASGTQHMLAITVDPNDPTRGQLWAWGVGGNGQLGTGGQQNSPTPVLVAGLQLEVPGPHPRIVKQELTGAEVGQTGVAKTFTIENYGTATLELASIEIVGADAKDFELVKPVKTSLLPGEQTTFKVSFKPTSVGEKVAQVEIKNNDIGDDDYVFDLSSTAQERAPKLSLTTVNPADAGMLSATTVDFGELEGGSKSITFKLENTGGGKLELSGTPFVGVSGDGFEIKPLPDKHELLAGESTTFTVEFQPKHTGKKTGTLSIPTNANPIRLDLTGTKIGPALEVSAAGKPLDGAPIELPFPSRPPGSASELVTITLRNTGNRELTIATPLALAGVDMQDFQLVGSPTSPLAPDQSTSFDLRFAPKAGNPGGSKQATLTLTSNDPERAAIVLTLRGDAVSGTTPDPASYFAPVRFFTYRATLACTPDGQVRSWPDVLLSLGRTTPHAFMRSGITDAIGVAQGKVVNYMLHREGKIYPVELKTINGKFNVKGEVARVTTPLPGVENVVQIGTEYGAIGRRQGHGAIDITATLVYLCADGSLWYWRDKPVLIRKGSVRSFYSDLWTTVMLNADGTMDSTVSLPSPPTPLTDVISVSCGGHIGRYGKDDVFIGNFAAALTSSGAVWAWQSYNPNAEVLPFSPQKPTPISLPRGSVKPEQLTPPPGVKLKWLVRGANDVTAVDEHGDAWELHSNYPATKAGLPKNTIAVASRYTAGAPLPNPDNTLWTYTADGHVYHSGVCQTSLVGQKTVHNTSTLLPL